MELIDLYKLHINKKFQKPILSSIDIDINNKKDKDYEVLINKILMLLEHYLTISRIDIESDFMNSLYDAMDYLNELLAQKYRLEKQIEEVQNKLKNGKISEIGVRK